MKMKNDLRSRLNAELSSVVWTEHDRLAVLRRIDEGGEQPMKKKLSAGLAVVIALVILTVGAIAAVGSSSSLRRWLGLTDAQEGVSVTPTEFNRVIADVGYARVTLEEAFSCGEAVAVSYRISTGAAFLPLPLSYHDPDGEWKLMPLEDYSFLKNMRDTAGAATLGEYLQKTRKRPLWFTCSTWPVGSDSAGYSAEWLEPDGTVSACCLLSGMGYEGSLQKLVLGFNAWPDEEIGKHVRYYLDGAMDLPPEAEYPFSLTLESAAGLTARSEDTVSPKTGFLLKDIRYCLTPAGLLFSCRVFPTENSVGTLMDLCISGENPEFDLDVRGSTSSSLSDSRDFRRVSGILLRRKDLPARMCFHLELPSEFEIVSVDVIPDE